MGMVDKDLDITKNIKLIEWLKSELVSGVGNMYRLMLNGVKDSQSILTDSIANIILLAYLLGKRLGISYVCIDNKVKEKIRAGIMEEHELEKWYGDLSSLKKHIQEKR